MDFEMVGELSNIELIAVVGWAVPNLLTSSQ